MDSGVASRSRWRRFPGTDVTPTPATVTNITIFYIPCGGSTRLVVFAIAEGMLYPGMCGSHRYNRRCALMLRSIRDACIQVAKEADCHPSIHGGPWAWAVTVAPRASGDIAAASEAGAAY
jgi:hypothetical protein